MDITRRSVLTLLSSTLFNTPAIARPFFDITPPERMRYSPEHADQMRAELYGLLGKLPSRERPVAHTKIREEEREGYILVSLTLDLNGMEPVPAYLARPKNLSSPAPAVLFNHSHGGNYAIGKNEFIEGREYLQDPPYACVLTEMGYIALCFDAWTFGDRAHTSEMDMFKAMLWQDHVLWGMMVYDSIKSVDYLVTREDVDPKRIATMGISMGSTMAWWLAALDERIAVTIDICCLTDMHTFLAEGSLAGHGIYYFVPGLLNRFSTSDINALIAPRPHLALAGIKDGLTPVAGLDVIDTNLKEIYRHWNASDNWNLLRYDAGHQETPEGRAAIQAFLRKHL